MSIRHAAGVLTTIAALVPPEAQAVMVSPDGQGQALIYPYYTVRSNQGNTFNTYVSIVNTTGGAKALRVRFREARNGRETAAFNLFLGGNDVWTGAVVPDGSGTKLVTADKSCVQPAFGPTRDPLAPAPGLPFSNAAFAGSSADGAGEGLDRTREGFVEVLEMARLIDSSNLAALHASDGYPNDCGAFANVRTADVYPPLGGLTGSLTLINVAGGQDFTVAAQALDNLARNPYYRPISDPYPGFTAAEIDPVSIVESNGVVYRSTWTRGLDAVNAALTRHPSAEYVLDPTVAAATDFIVTFPTRHAAVTATTAAAPFQGRTWQQPQCGLAATGGEAFTGIGYYRESASTALGSGGSPLGATPDMLCGSANVLTMRNTDRPLQPVLGSTSENYNFTHLGLLIRAGFQAGWARFVFASLSMVSGADSTRTDAATGQVMTGPHTYTGLPLVGLVVRSLSNGYLDCGGKLCQGNYGGSFPMSYTRAVTP